MERLELEALLHDLIAALADGPALRQPAGVQNSPFEALIGHDLDTVSFVRDYVELRIDYSIIRLLTDPCGWIGDEAWNLTEASGTDQMRRYIGRVLVAADFDPASHLQLTFADGAVIRASLRDDDRFGPEALHFLPADSTGRVDTATMHIW